MPTISDYLQQPVGAGLSPVVGTWVQLTNNATSTAYVATAATNANGKFTVNNVPAGTYTVATGPASIGPFTSTGDTNYVVAAGPWQVDITDFGGKGDGVTANDTAMTNAQAALTGSKGIILLPPGAFVFNNAINVSGTTAVRIKGAGPARTSGTDPVTQIKFLGTSGPLVNASTSTGFELEDVEVQWPNAFNGVVISLDSSNFGRLRNVLFQATGGGANAGLIASLDQCTRPVIEGCEFHNAVAAIQGLSTGGHFSNVVTIRDCNFSSSTGDISTRHINNAGQGWAIYGNTFEMGQTAGNCALLAASVAPGVGLQFVGNWVGDQGANAVTQMVVGNGSHIAGNYLGGSAASTCISLPNGTNGVAIKGNEFATHSVAVAIGTSVSNFEFGPNDFSSVTTRLTGTPSSGGLQLQNGTTNVFGATAVFGDVGTDRGFGPGTPAVGTQNGRLYMGSGVPSNTNGNNGDFYFRTDTPGTANQRLYIKSAGSWTALTL